MLSRILLPSLFAVALCGCGPIDSVPVSTVTDPPTIVFFNGNDAGNKVRFSGTASDPNGVKQVEVSLDGGATYLPAPATLQALGGGDYLWHLDVVAAQVPASYTLVTRAINNGNVEEAPGAGTAGVMVAGNTASTLSSTGSFAYPSSQVLYLSTGSGGAFGASTGTRLLLQNQVEMTIVGMGSGAGGTVLEAPASASCIFSPGAGLTLRNVRVRGGELGLRASLASGGTLRMDVSHCHFSSQSYWGIKAQGGAGNAGSLSLAVSSTDIDASAPFLGGIYCRQGALDLFDCAVSGAVNVSNPALPVGGVCLVSASDSSRIDSCLFTGNGFAINASNTSLVIASCSVTGSTIPSNGVRLAGGTAVSPRLQFNVITSNSGYGVAILGKVVPVLYHNSIISNGTLDSGGTGGIYIRGDFPGPSYVNLGNSGDLATGYNTITGNMHNNGTVGGAVFVAADSTGIEIKAENNWWGTADDATIGTLIWDGVDQGGVVPHVDFIPKLGSEP